MIASPNVRSSSTAASFQSQNQIRSSSSSSISRNGLTLRRPHSVAHRFFKSQHASLSISPKSHFASKPLNLVMLWQDCKVKIEVDVPASVAYECYSDRESMPKWLPFVSSVKVSAQNYAHMRMLLFSNCCAYNQILEDQKDVSEMHLKYSVLGQQLEFSLLARNLQPIPNQKIHWRSMEGLPNRGAVRFYPKGPSSCLIELTVSYEVPAILAPVSSALIPFTEGMLLRGLERFSSYAKEYQHN